MGVAGGTLLQEQEARACRLPSSCLSMAATPARTNRDTPAQSAPEGTGEQAPPGLLSSTLVALSHRAQMECLHRTDGQGLSLSMPAS